MAVLSGIFAPGSPAGVKLAVNNAAASAVQVAGARSCLLQLHATGIFHVRWGNSTDMTAADTNCMAYPANTLITLETGSFTHFSVFNDSGSAIAVYWMPLSR